MTNESLVEENSEAKQVELEPTVNENQEQVPEIVPEPVIDPTEERISGVEKRIRNLAQEKNDYKDEVKKLREQLLTLTEKPLIEPNQADYGEDINAFVDAKFDYKMKVAEQAKASEHNKQTQARQAEEAKTQDWQSKIDSLPPEKSETYFKKVSQAQEAGKLNLPSNVLDSITASPVGPEIVLELIENPTVANAIQGARSAQEVQSIVSNVENFYASKRFSLGNQQAPQATQKTNTSAPPAMSPPSSTSEGIYLDPKKMSAQEFQKHYKTIRK